MILCCSECLDIFISENKFRFYMTKLILPFFGGFSNSLKQTNNLKRCWGLLLMFALSFQLHAQTCGLSLNHVNVTCIGANDGVLQIDVNNGTPPYTATWTDAMGAPLPAAILALLPTTVTSNGLSTYTGFPTGTYFLNLGNGGDCQGFALATIGVDPDNVNPVITCPANISVGTDAGDCGAVVTFADPSASDNCDVVSLVCDPPSGSTFAVGTTPVTCTATDAAGNSSVCTFNVTVTDNEPPVLDCTTLNPVRPANAGLCTFTMVGGNFNPTATSDNCGATLVNDLNGTATLAGTTFDVGVTPVTWTLTDAAGNSVNCTVNYEITDTQNPTIACPANIAVGTDAGTCGAVVSWAAPATTDNCPGETVTSSHVSGSVFPLGTTTVSYTVTDVAGNVANCSFTVTVADNEDPTISCPADINTTGDLTLCGAVVTWAEPVSGDNCPGETVVSSHNSGDTFNVGTTTVSYTVTDAAGNTASCSFDVVVEDTEAPTIICPLDITLSSTEGNCGAIATWTTPATDDNCGVSTVVSTHNSGDVFSVGTTTVTYTVTDLYNNTATCNFDVIVTDDTPPAITCPADITATTDAGLCSAVVTFANPIATDDCGTVTVTCNPASGSTFNIGTTPVTCTATDAAGNTTTCNFDIIVTDDEDPVIACPATITTTSDVGMCNAVVTWTDPVIGTDATDNCGVVSVVCSPVSGSTFPVGTTPVTCTATDAAGNTATCTFDVVVTDNNPPVITCPADITTNMDSGVCGAVVTFANPLATDDCGATTVTCSPASGSVFGIGTTSVTCTATDAAGNTATCDFDVIVIDTEAPTIICPLDITVASDPNVCGAMVTWNAPQTDDNCAVDNVSVSHLPGNIFPVGTTTVTYTVTDPSGNTATCDFDITVTDDGEPTIVCPADIGIGTDAGVCSAVVTWADPIVADDCGIASVVCTPASGSTFNIGTTTVTCVATDDNGNSFSCTFDVTVTDDEDPAIVCPANITTTTDANACSAVVTWTDPVIGTDATDNCGVVSVVCNPPSGSTFPLGTTPVTCTATDAAGNTATCTFDVVVTDGENPTIACPANITLAGSGAGCSAIGTWADPVAADNCGIASVVCDPPSGSTFAGTTVVTCTATDNAGNTAICTFTVTVEDGSDPVIACPTDINTATTAGACSTVVTWADPVATDDCGAVTTVCDPPSGSTFQLGTTTVTCTTTDGVGNTAICSFDVTVVDGEDPAIVCPANITTTTDADVCGAVVTWTDPVIGVDATDNCGVVSVVCNPPSGTTFPVGTTPVTCVATDAAGNTATCTFDVTVADEEDPTIVCPANITLAGAGAGCSAVVTWPNPIAEDNCGIASIVCNPPSGSTFSGTTVVTCTATDNAGNTANCTFTVTIEDGANPVITCPADINVGTAPGVCSAVVTWADPVATDDCGAVTTVCNPPSGSTFQVGTTTVTCTTTDGVGNTASCTFDVTVADDENPTIFLCGSTQTVLTSSNGAGDCTGTVPDLLLTYPNQYSAIDNCDVTLSQSPPVGTTFGSVDGSTQVVVMTATDPAGNSVSCNVTLTLVDDEDPTITCPENVVVNSSITSCDGVAVWPEPVAADNCDVTLTSTHNSGDVFPGGVTVVTYTATDGAGNTATCSFTVTVESISGEITCPADVVVESDPWICSGIATFDAPAFVACPGADVSVMQITGMTSGSMFNVGTTVVGYALVDNTSGAFVDFCYFNVTVLDTEAPLIVNCPEDITVDVDDCETELDVFIPIPVILIDYKDNCGNASIVNSYTNTDDASGLYPVGTTSVIWTVTDDAGNTTTCEQLVTVNGPGGDVTVCEDVELISDQDLFVNDGGFASNGTVSFTDATSAVGATTSNGTLEMYFRTEGTSCESDIDVELTAPDGTVMSYPAVIASCNADNALYFVSVPVGNTTITASPAIWTLGFDDSNGQNAGDEYSFRFGRLSYDACTTTGVALMPELINCPVDMMATVTGNGVCMAPISVPVPVFGIDYTDCIGATMTNDYNGTANGSDNYPIGTTLVTWTVTNTSGVSVTCEQTITVSDVGPTIITCPADIAQETDPGSCEATVVVPPIVYTDCGTATAVNDYTNTENASAVYPLGATVVVWTVTDNDGNTATCDQTITISEGSTVVTEKDSLTILSDQDGLIDDIGFANNPVMTFADPGTAAGNITNLSLKLWFKTVDMSCEQDIAVQLLDPTGAIVQTWPAGTVFTPPACVSGSGGTTGGYSNMLFIMTLPISNPGLATVAAGDWTVQFDDGNGQNAGNEYSFRFGTLDYCAETQVVVSGGGPAITSCPSDVIIDAPVGTCEAAVTIPALEAQDCGTFTVVNDYNGTADASGTYPAGTTAVTWTVTDNDGLTATCVTNVTVNANGLVITSCPADMTVTANQAGCTADVTVPALTATGCGAVTITNDNTGTADASGNYPLGNTTVVWTVTDADGNMATCSTDITVTAAALAITTCPADMTVTAAAGECDAAVTVPALEATGCGALSITNDYNNTADASDTYTVGTTTVVWTVTDATGAQVTCSTDITVEDGATTVTVMDTVSIVSDQDGFVDDTGFASNPVMNFADPGTAAGVVTAMDLKLWFRLEGASCEQDIEVELMDPSGATVATFLTGSVFATCNGGNSLYINTLVIPPSGVAPTAGNWTVTFNDATGQNAGDEYSFRAGVLTYVTTSTTTLAGGAPVITSCPADVTVGSDAGTCAADVTIPALVAQDCGTITITNDYTNTADASGNYPIGTTVVTWTVTDDDGNSVNCQTVVTVTDSEGPTIVFCPADVTLVGDPNTCDAQVTIPTPADVGAGGFAFTDCGTGTVSNDYTGTDDASGVYDVGSTIVVWTVTDNDGNTATCEQTVTVTSPEVSEDVQIVSDLDGPIDDVGFANNPNMPFIDPATPANAVLSNINLRLFFRVKDASCEEDIVIQVSDPTGGQVLAPTTIFTGCAGTSGGTSVGDGYSDSLYVVDVVIPNGTTTGAINNWIVEFDDNNGQNASTEYSFRFGLLTYTATMNACGPMLAIEDNGPIDSSDFPTNEDTQMEDDMLVYPVPTMSNLNLEFNASNDERANITVISTTGSVMMSVDRDVFEGFNKVELDVTPLPAGNYYVRVQTTSDVPKVKPFVKINP